VVTTICLHVTLKANVISIVFLETDGPVDVTCSHVHCNCGNSSEMVQDTVNVITDH